MTQTFLSPQGHEHGSFHRDVQRVKCKDCRAHALAHTPGSMHAWVAVALLPPRRYHPSRSASNPLEDAGSTDRRLHPFHLGGRGLELQ